MTIVVDFGRHLPNGAANEKTKDKKITIVI
jgi:hypothetical protein